MKNLAISLDIGATNLRVAVVSRQGKIIKKISQKTEKKTATLLSKQIVCLTEKMILSSSLSKILGIGISATGPLDIEKGTIRNNPNLKFSSVQVVKPIEKKFKLPVSFLNDCKAGVLGEKYFGDGKNNNNLVYVTISSGIGGGAIVDGNLLLGSKGNAVEVGHFVIDSKYNLLCSCKEGKGHWEAYSSGENIPKFFKFWLKKNNIDINFKPKETKDIFNEAKNNKIVKNFILYEIGKINARGISNIIIAYNPELITIGGSIAFNNQNLILKPIKKYVDRFLTLPKIKITSLGEDIGILGAAASVFFI